MKLFRRRSLPTKTPLFEAPKGGDPIVLDEEELEAVKAEGANIAESLEGYSFQPAVADVINRQLLAAPGLMKVARLRLERGDFKGAGETCMKAIGFAGDDPSTWLLLAGIMIEYGDLARAEGIIGQAEGVAAKAGFGRQYKEETSQALRDRIEFKLMGLSGDEEAVRLLRSAEVLLGAGHVKMARASLAEAETLANEENVMGALKQSGVIDRVRKRVAKGS